MAVVGKEEIYIDNKRFEFKIRVLKDGLFRTEIPPELVDHAADYRQRYDGRRMKKIVEYECETKDELIDRLKLLRNTVKDSSTKKNKVILYKIAVECTIEGPAKFSDNYDPEHFKDPEEIVVLRRPSSHWRTGMDIGISAAVAIEHEITALDGTKRYSYYTNEVPRDERLPDGLHGSNLGRTNARIGRVEELLDWTQERHDFFTAIYEAMSHLAWQLHNLAKPGNIDKAIESGVKLIGGTENESNN